MVIRVRLSASFSPIGVEESLRPRLAPAVGLLMTPLALLAFTISIWAFAAELQWSGEFIFSNSLLAHWQVWLAMAAVLMILGRLLTRCVPTD